MTPKAADTIGEDRVVGDWIVRFEPRTLADLRQIVQSDIEDERRFAAVRRLSQINLRIYRTLFQPFVCALASEQSAAWQHQMQPSGLPFELFSDRNPLMQRLARLADSVRKPHRPWSAENPFVMPQEAVSSQIVAALDRDGVISAIKPSSRSS